MNQNEYELLVANRKITRLETELYKLRELLKQIQQAPNIKEVKKILDEAK
jgi:hypothetical protein